MADSKNIFTSKTIAGIFILLIPTIRSTLGIELSEQEVTSIFSNINLIFDLGLSVFGGVMAIYGRITAKKNLTI